MFRLFKKPQKSETKKQRHRAILKLQTEKPQPKAANIISHHHGDTMYDIMKKISDLQDQLSRHDSKMHDKLEDHHSFMENQHHEPMKKVAIEIMNKLYAHPEPLRQEIFKLIKSDEDILSVIGENKISSSEVAAQVGLSKEHISRRISTLTKAGYLNRIYEGRSVFYTKAERNDVKDIDEIDVTEEPEEAQNKADNNDN